MTVAGFNAIIDLNHNDAVTSWDMVHQNGIHAIIHKATEGIDVQDSAYHRRRDATKAKGFLFGSYHFASGHSVKKQVDNYLTWAAPAKDELIALDYEKSSSGANMTYDQACEFVSLIKEALGRYPVIYGAGDLLIPKTKGKKNSPLASCPLWIASYPKASATQPAALADPWTTWTIWQYTDGHYGPAPHTVPGAACDRDTYNGSGTDLQQKWPLT